MRAQTEGFILGILMISGVVLTTVAGYQLQDRLMGNVIESSPAVPQSVKFIILGSVAFGVSWGYLIREMEIGGDTDED